MGDLELKVEFCPIIPNAMQSFEIPIEMRVNYLERRLKEFSEMRSMDCHMLCEKAKFIGHQIKGNADSFGFYELTDAAYSLEEAGRAMNAEKVNDVLLSITSLVEANLKQLVA